MRKRWPYALTALALAAGLTAAALPLAGRAQYGAEPANPFLPQQPGHPLANGFSQPRAGEPPRDAKPSEEPEPNRDILVTPDVGEWMILICSYQGDKRHAWARQMVAELRGPNYRLPAYVFNYGREARLAEEKRNQEFKELQRKYLLDLGIDDPKAKIRVRKITIKEEAGVLVGGYKDMATARRALDEIRKLKAPDPERVELDKAFTAYRDKKTGKEREHWVYVNPFHRAFVVRNPTIKREAAKPQLDLALLQRLNASEEFSLLKCPKKVTLVVKEFRMPASFEREGDGKLPWQSGAVDITGGEDLAGKNAHLLAKALRSMNPPLEAYVLHTQYSSIVTVGAFDSVQDPRIRVLRERMAQLQNSDPEWQRLRMYPSAPPMLVPR